MERGGLGSAASSQPGRSSQPVDNQPSADSDRSNEASQDSTEAGSGKGSEAPDARQKRLARIKAEIEAGEYDTDEKLEAALSRMFDQLDLDDE